MLVAATVFFFLVFFALGCVIGAAGERAGWVLRASEDVPHYRTAVCAGGKFYYVIPEAEFCREWRRKERHEP